MDLAMLATAVIEAEHKREKSKMEKRLRKEAKEAEDFGEPYEDLGIPEEDLIPVPPGWDFGWDFPED